MSPSQFFRQLFRRLGGSDKTVVFLKDVDPRHLELLIQFIYKGEFHIPQGELTNLLETAKSLEIHGLNSTNDYTERCKATRPSEGEAVSSASKFQKTDNQQHGNSDLSTVKVKEELPEHLDTVTPDITVDNEGFIKTDIGQDQSTSSAYPVLYQNV